MMELWIRSQDKNSLTKVSNLSLREIEHPVRHDTEYWSIGTYYDNLQILGKYTTKERALEVLNEIHQRLINLETLKIAPDSYKVLPKNTSNVYEMPKE